MTSITLSLETAFSLLIGFAGLILTIAAGYATLRERIRTNEIHTAHIRKEITELKVMFFDVMRALNVIPREKPHTEDDDE